MVGWGAALPLARVASGKHPARHKKAVAGGLPALRVRPVPSLHCVPLRCSAMSRGSAPYPASLRSRLASPGLGPRWHPRSGRHLRRAAPGSLRSPETSCPRLALWSVLGACKGPTLRSGRCRDSLRSPLTGHHQGRASRSAIGDMRSWESVFSRFCDFFGSRAEATRRGHERN